MGSLAEQFWKVASSRTWTNLTASEMHEKLVSQYQRDFAVTSTVSRYIPDVHTKSYALGKGGCFSTVERSEHHTLPTDACSLRIFWSLKRAYRSRYYEQSTRKPVAVKKMTKEHIQVYGDLLHKESLALCSTKALKVPRVINWIDIGQCGHHTECVVLE